LGKNDLIIATGTYTIGAFTPRVPFAKTRVNGQERKNFTSGLNVEVGSGDVRAVIARHTSDGGNKTTKFGVGYLHRLSQRTKLYVDVATAKTGNLSRKTASDLGIQHAF